MIDTTLEDSRTDSSSHSSSSITKKISFSPLYLWIPHTHTETNTHKPANHSQTTYTRNPSLLVLFDKKVKKNLDMMLHIVKKFVLVLLLLVGTVKGEYEFNHSISSLPGYLIEWTITGDEIELRLTAPTTGWVGFGISESGGMIGGDEFVAHVDDTTGAVVSNDYHSTVQDFSTPPVLDTCNDWVVVSGIQTTQKTIITVKRKLDTNDTYVLYTHVFSRSFVHTHTHTHSDKIGQF